MAGYLPDEANADAFVDGWYRTGDIGWLEPEGWVHLTDRSKEMIKVKGFQVAPAELEAVLHGHPGVLDCAVFGVPDDRAGEVPVAAVQLDPDRPVDRRGAAAPGRRHAGHLQAAAARWSWSTPSPGSRRARCCAGSSATSGRPARRAVPADGRPPLARAAGAARRPRPRWSTASARRSVGALDDAERVAKLDAAVAGTGWRELRAADEGDAAAGLRASRWPSSPRSSAGAWPTPPSSARPWPPSSGAWPARRPAPRPRPSR